MEMGRSHGENTRQQVEHQNNWMATQQESKSKNKTMVRSQNTGTRWTREAKQRKREKGENV